MTDKKEPENPPAFPGAVFPEHPNHPNGMTLRDYFAIRIASAAIAATLTKSSKPAIVLFEDVASLSYQGADALLAEREK